jgi:DNA-binding LacI/PurR family transcriptional regulator/DNA-binding transcriptional regulator YhcF (GntR family)
MPRLKLFTAAEQVAAHLRAEIVRGVWSGAMPGGDRLAAELGIGCNTAEAALALLEKEGLLMNRGRRRGRMVAARPGLAETRALRVAILYSEAVDRGLDYMIELEHALSVAGHTRFAAPKTMMDLNMNTRRIARMVGKTDADAWVVLGGAADLLEWFTRRQTPTYAIFGRRRSLAVAGVGPDKSAAMIAATRRLVELGHRRIVLLARPRRRLPMPGLSEQTFLDELAAQGLPTGQYNLPPWEESVDGFHGRLKALFRVTPPTALIIQEVPFFLAALQFLSRRRLSVPDDVSLICTDHSPDFDWCRPTVSHIRWESRPLVRSVLKWTENMSLGRRDLRQTEIQAEFVEGGTIGRARRVP